MKKPLVGFIGQGFIGKNMADDFEERGYKVIRYSLEPEYINNKEKIKECDVVFIAVPTPTTPKGFDGSILENAIKAVGKAKIAVIKSTIVPEFTKKIQKNNPKTTVLHSPEFLSEATAKEDARNPFINIVGVPNNSKKHSEAAKLVMSILPNAPKKIICSSEESALIKYAHNCSAYVQIIFFNIFYDLSTKYGARWEQINNAIVYDPYVPNRYASPVHKSGRGAGGHCFPKDFEVFLQMYRKVTNDSVGTKILEAMRDKNNALLKASNKDLDILEGIYGAN